MLYESGMEDKPLAVNKLKDTFVSLKINENTGNSSFNVVKNCFGESYMTHWGHSTNHVIVQIIKDKVYEDFEKNKYTFGVLIDLPKAFDTIDHKLFLSKLKIYGINKTIFKSFKNYLTNRKPNKTITKKEFLNM